MSEDVVKAVREAVRTELEPVKKRLVTIEDRLFIGSNGRPSLQEEFTEFRVHLETLKAKPRCTPKVPPAFWKAAIALILALATAAGGAAALP